MRHSIDALDQDVNRRLKLTDSPNRAAASVRCVCEFPIFEQSSSEITANISFPCLHLMCAQYFVDPRLSSSMVH